MILQRRGIARHGPLQWTEPADRDGQGGHRQYPARGPAHRREVGPDPLPSARRALAQNRNGQERHGGTGRVEKRHEQGRRAHPVVGGGHGDGGQDRAGARNEDQAQAQPENQPAAPAGIAGCPQAAEGALDPLAGHRKE